MQDYTGVVVPQQTDYVEPSPMVASDTNSYEQAAPTRYQSTSRYQAPPPYNEVPQSLYAATDDKAQLIQNEIGDLFAKILSTSDCFVVMIRFQNFSFCKRCKHGQVCM